MIAITLLQFVAWALIGAPTMVAVTFVAGRLLGARRGWVSLLVAGLVGWTVAVLLAGDLTDWDWGSVAMPLVSLGFGVVLTMIVALGIDLLAPVGSLATGEQAGLVGVTNPVGGLRAQRARIRRYREVVHQAQRHGLVGRDVSHDTLPTGVRQTLEDAGGMFVKLGQVASTRADVLPAKWCEELALLRSGAEPAPEAVMRDWLRDALGAPVEDRFAEFDWTPLASASMAQVYRARLADGSVVAVKVQRPGLDEIIEIDAGAVLDLAALIERRTALGLSMRPAELAAEFIANVREELDFRIEASNGAALDEAFAGRPKIRVPAVYPALSTDRVLTEEYVDAVSIADAETIASYGLDRSELADRLLGEFLYQMFQVGVFHSDPHPGNILVEPDGTIVLIDLGAVGRLSGGQREVVVSLMLAASEGDSGTLADTLLEVASIDPTADLRQLRREIDELLARHMRSGGGISTEAFQDLAVVVGRYGLRLPRWFGMLSRTMVTLEGTLRSIDPDFSLVDAAKDHAAAMLPGGDGKLSSFKSLLEEEAKSQLPRLRRLPRRVDDILGQAAAGRLTVRLSPFADERTERIVTRLVDRVVLGVLAAAIGVGSVLLLGVQGGPTLHGELELNEVIGYAGLAAAAVLSLRIAAGIIRDGTT